MIFGRPLLLVVLSIPAVGSACVNEVGAKCLDDSNCPSGQYCSASACAVGNPGAGASDAGVDAGPLAPLAGNVTLNGGAPLPIQPGSWPGIIRR